MRKYPNKSCLCQAPTEPKPAPGLKKGYSTIARAIPGDGYPVAGVHPSLEVSDVNLSEIEARITGMDFFPDGRLAFSTWNALGTVFIMENPDSDSSVVTPFCFRIVRTDGAEDHRRPDICTSKR